MSSTATVVASDPVPGVVGIARWGSSGADGLRPPPTGGLTYSMTGAGSVDDQARDLRRVHRRPAADRHEPVDAGLGGERARLLQRLERRLDAGAVVARRRRSRASSDARTRGRACPAAATPGSVTRNARETPSRASSQPASSTAPDAVLDRRRLDREDRLVHVHQPLQSTSRSGAGIASPTGLRVARSTKTCTNQPGRRGLRRSPRRTARSRSARSTARGARRAARRRHDLGERERPVELAVRLRAEPDHLAVVDVEPALARSASG